MNKEGNTLAVGATQEQSSATSIQEEQTINEANRAGAVYVFELNIGMRWLFFLL